MALDVWTQPSGHNLGTFPEQAQLDLSLPTHNDAGVTYRVISGALPKDVRLDSELRAIVGSPAVVSSPTLYTFCIRASNELGNIADRTFLMTVSGNNAPVFVTPTGSLPIGMHHQLYALDQTYVSYQLEAFDLNTIVGKTLTYSILSGDGELPPGLTLSADGLISGFILPAIKITPADGSGTFDESVFDAVAYDFAVPVPSSGFDDIQYDDEFYDYASPDATPTTLNRNYQFIVTLTDGVSYAQRLFRIFVIGDDQFKADNTALEGQVGGLFTADVTYIREPAWYTGSSLGLHRANNYITIPIALYNRENVLFRLEPTNKEVYAVAKHLAGVDNLLGSTSLSIINASAAPQFGQWLTFDYYFTGATGQTHQISNVAPLGNNSYRLTITPALDVAVPDDTVFYIGSLSTLPKGTKFDENSSEVYGVIPYQPAITTRYTFTITATRQGLHNESLTVSKTFTIDIIGEVESVISWVTPSDLGNIDANYVSTLKVEATTSISNGVVVYSLVSGSLPNGLTFNGDGEIIGKPNQYNNPTLGQGLISFNVDQVAHPTHSGLPTTFDKNTTSFDRVYKFTVKAQDQYGYSAITRTFTVKLNTPNTLSYSNIRTKPYLKSSQRTAWRDFINNTTVFTPGSIYRPNDPAFGVQSELNMLVYAGIETTAAAAYVGAMGLNHKTKRFQFGTLSSAIAIDPETNKEVYEVIYVTMHDPREFNGKHLPHKIQGRGLESDTISADISTLQLTVDSQGYEASNPKVKEYFPNSITNWQNNLSNIGATERNYLPLWMRTIQPGTKEQLGYQLAVPLCYCKVGSSAGIILNINNYIKTTGFSFSNIDYTVDRYIIDSVTGYASDKYLVFRNDRITV